MRYSFPVERHLETKPTITEWSVTDLHSKCVLSWFRLTLTLTHTLDWISQFTCHAHGELQKYHKYQRKKAEMLLACLWALANTAPPGQTVKLSVLIRKYMHTEFNFI